MRLTNRGGGGERWCHKLRSEVGFHVEGNSSSSFAGSAVLVEENVTLEINFMVLCSSLCSHVSVTPITSMWLRLARLLS